MDRTGEASTSGIINSERVVDALKSSGALEQLRKHAVAALERDEALRHAVDGAVADSKALRDFQGHKPNRALMSRLQDELADGLSTVAVNCLWWVLNEGSVSQEINEATRAVMCRQRQEQQQAAVQQRQQ